MFTATGSRCVLAGPAHPGLGGCVERGDVDDHRGLRVAAVAAVVDLDGHLAGVRLDVVERRVGRVPFGGELADRRGDDVATGVDVPVGARRDQGLERRHEVVVDLVTHAVQVADQAPQPRVEGLDLGLGLLGGEGAVGVTQLPLALEDRVLQVEVTVLLDAEFAVEHALNCRQHVLDLEPGQSAARQDGDGAVQPGRSFLQAVLVEHREVVQQLVEGLLVLGGEAVRSVVAALAGSTERLEHLAAGECRRLGEGRNLHPVENTGEPEQDHVLDPVGHVRVVDERLQPLHEAGLLADHLLQGDVLLLGVDRAAELIASSHLNLSP